MGTPKQSSGDRQNQGYQMAMSGQDPAFLKGRTDTNLAQGFWAGHSALQQQKAQEQAMMNMFAGMFEGAGAGGTSSGPSYADQMAQQQAEYEQRLAEQRRAEGIAKRDSMYGNYLTAAGSATDYVNSQIDKERSNAALLGIDYNLDDAKKAERISNYFATVWGEGDQTQLEQAMSEWGNPSGFTDWTITRGDASAHQSADGGEETLVGTSQGKKILSGSLVDDDELLGV